MRTKRQPTVDFCESRGKACDAWCRGNEIIDQKRDRALLSGWKLA